MTEPSELRCFPTWTAGRKGYAERIRGVFREHLERKDLLYTDQREAILETLLAAERHLSQEEIYASVRPRGIGKVTVFRTLKLLLESGLAAEVTGSGGRTLFEVKLDRPHHDHLVCLQCGTVTEVEWPDLERVQQKILKEAAFEAYYHRHEVFGRCRECRTRPD